MQLDRIKQYQLAYRNWLATRAAEERLYYWESQQYWQQQFDLSAANLKETYDRSLDNRQTRRLWNRQAYAPKEMMLQFLDIEAEYVRTMFTELFNEDKSIEFRVDRFVFYCDQLLEQYLEKRPVAPHRSHYHDDQYSMISLYLAFQYPDKYAPYEETTFLTLLHRLGAANIPPVGDFGRHCKLMRTLLRFLKQDEALLSAHQNRLRANRDYPEESLMLAFDFAKFIVQAPVRN